MTTKDTEKASPDAEPKEGEVLLYINHLGAKIYGKPPEEKPTKKSHQPT